MRPPRAVYSTSSRVSGCAPAASGRASARPQEVCGGRQRQRSRYLAAAVHGNAGCGRGSLGRSEPADTGRSECGAAHQSPDHRCQRLRRGREHRRARARQLGQAGLRQARQRRGQDALRRGRERRPPAPGGQGARRGHELQARLRAGPPQGLRRQGRRRGHHRDAEPLARARHDLGRCRPASTSTSRSRPATRSSKAGGWCRRRPATRRSSRSAR